MPLVEHPCPFFCGPFTKGLIFCVPFTVDPSWPSESMLDLDTWLSQVVSRVRARDSAERSLER